VLEPLIALDPSRRNGELHFLIGLALMGTDRPMEAEFHLVQALNPDTKELAAENTILNKSDPTDRGNIRLSVKKKTSEIVHLAKRGYAKWRSDMAIRDNKQKYGNK